MAKKYTIVVEKDDSGYFISEVVGLPGCHTQAKTMDELITRTKEAIELYLDDTDVDSSHEFIGTIQIEV